MSTVIGSVTASAGRAVAIDASGNERLLALGDAILEGDLIRSGPDARIEITLDGVVDPIVLDGSQNWLATADTFNPPQDYPVDESVASVDAIQAAILAGQDPTEVLEPAAAGAPAAGGTNGNEGADFVQLERTAGEVTPEAGFETTGLSFDLLTPTGEPGFLLADDEPQPLPTVVELRLFAVVDGEYVAANTIYEPGYQGALPDNEQFELYQSVFEGLSNDQYPASGQYVVLAFDAEGNQLAVQPGGSLTVNIGQPGDSASGGDDYSPAGGQLVTVGQVFEVGALDDALADNNETFTLGLGNDWSNPGGYDQVNYNPAPVTTTIVDETANDDPESPPTYDDNDVAYTFQLFGLNEEGEYVEANSIQEEGETSAQYIVLAVDGSGDPLAPSDQPSGTVEVSFTNTPPTTNDDYTVVGTTVTVGTAFTSTAVDDVLADNGETFTVGLVGNYSNAGDYEAIEYNSHTVETTIVDETDNDDPQDPPTYNDNDVAYTFQLFGLNEEGEYVTANSIQEEGETSARYIVLAVDANNNPLPASEQPSGTVEVSFTNNDTTTDDDYTVAGATVTVGSTFTSTAVDDLLADNGETFTVGLVGNYSNAADYEAIEYSSNTVETTILDSDTTATIGDGSVVVSEEGLNIPTDDKVGIADSDAGTGFNDTTNSPMATGSLAITGNGTAPLILAIDLGSLPTGLESGGNPVSWSYESGNSAVAVGTTADGEVIRIELNGGSAALNTAGSTPPGSAGYTVTLSQPVDHPENSLEDTLEISFNVSVSDGVNTPVDTGAITVTIEDDMPLENEDSQDLTVRIDTIEVGGLETGWTNQQGGDSSHQEVNNGAPGNDDVISWDPSNYTFNDNDGLINTQSVPVATQFVIGEFTHNNYPLSHDGNIDSVDLELSLDVVINGYTATLNHTINFQHMETPNSNDDPRDIVQIDNASTIVPVTITTAEGATETYNFQIIGFVDGSGNIVETVYTDENAANSYQLVAQLISSEPPVINGEVDYGFGADGPADDNPVDWDGMDSSNQIQGQHGVLTVNEDGTYSYQLDQSAYDALQPGEELMDSFDYTLTDADGDGVESTLEINISGEAAPQAPNLIPEGEDESVQLDIGTMTTSLLLTLDVSGSMDNEVNNGETRFEIAQQSLISTIQAYQTVGETEVNLTLFASRALNVGWMSAADAIDYLNGLSFGAGDISHNGSSLGIDRNTDYKAALETTGTVDFSGHPASQTIAYFLSDGEPRENENAVDDDNDATIQDWKFFIDGDGAGSPGNVDKLFVIGIGENVSDEYLEHVQVQAGAVPIMVSDDTQLLDTLTNTASVSVSGDVSDNYSGGDGAITIDSITLYGETYTADGQGGTTRFPNEGVALDGQGVLKFNFADGTYTYTARAGEFPEGLTAKAFSVTVSDQDGDAVSFSVNINVNALDTTASAPLLDGVIDTGTLTGTTQTVVEFSEDDKITLRNNPDSHSYDLPGTATAFSLDISSYKVSGNNDDDGQIRLYHNGVQVGSTLNLDNYGKGELNYSGTVAFDQVVVTRQDGNFRISDFKASVTQTTATYEYDLDLSAALTDLDGSETLSAVTIDGLPTGALVTGTGVTDKGDDTYEVALNSNGDAAGDVVLVVNRTLTQGELDDITISVTATETSTGHQNTVTATLVDGIVSGVAYTTSSGLSGLTDEDGSFQYREGDAVTFTVGSVVIGTAMSAELTAGPVFLQDLADVERSDLNDEYVENMAVLLQSLDADGSAGNGISITAATRAALEGASLNLRTVSETELKSFIEGLGANYVTEEDAMAHVRAMLTQEGGVTEFDEHQDDSVLTATLAHEAVEGLTWQTSSGLSGELQNGVFSYDEGDSVQFFTDGGLVAEFDTGLIGDDGIITLDEAGFDMAQAGAQQPETPDEVAGMAAENEPFGEDAAGSTEEEPAEAAALLYNGEELAFEYAAADTGDKTKSAADSSGGDENAGAGLVQNDVLSGNNSVDALLGTANTELSTAPRVGQEDGRDEADGAEIVDIDTGVSLDNLTGGLHHTPDV